MNRLTAWNFAIALISVISCQSDSGMSGPTPEIGTAITPGLGSAKGTSFSGYAYNCDLLDPGEIKVTGGGTVHIRGLVGTTLLVVGNPLLDGLATVSDVGANINPRNGVIAVHGRGVLVPEAVEGGSWRFVSLVHVSPNEPFVNRWNGQGTGALQGMSLTLELRDATGVPPSPCNSEDPSGVGVSGTIF